MLEHFLLLLLSWNTFQFQTKCIWPQRKCVCLWNWQHIEDKTRKKKAQKMCLKQCVTSLVRTVFLFFLQKRFEGQQKGRPRRSVWLNLRLTCGTGEIDEVPPSFTLCRERGYRNRTLQCGRRELGARSRRGVPRLINGTGGPSKTALPLDRARQSSKNNLAGVATPASSPNRLQFLKEMHFNGVWGENWLRVKAGNCYLPH